MLNLAELVRSEFSTPINDDESVQMFSKMLTLKIKAKTCANSIHHTWRYKQSKIIFILPVSNWLICFIWVDFESKINASHYTMSVLIGWIAASAEADHVTDIVDLTAGFISKNSSFGHFKVATNASQIKITGAYFRILKKESINKFELLFF
jgi:hypothetical protein